MDEFNNIQKYFNALGHFWQNFNNLEQFLRLYLYRKNGGDNISADNFMTLPINSICDENLITDYKSFGELSNYYNNYQKNEDKIDFTEIVNLRDALVHGRITQNLCGNEWQVFIIKYSRPENGKVTVEYKRTISSTDFEQIVEKIGKLYFEVSLKMGTQILS
jgi:hypothetical protein